MITWENVEGKEIEELNARGHYANAISESCFKMLRNKNFTSTEREFIVTSYRAQVLPSLLEAIVTVDMEGAAYAYGSRAYPEPAVVDAKRGEVLRRIASGETVETAFNDVFSFDNHDPHFQATRWIRSFSSATSYVQVLNDWCQKNGGHFAMENTMDVPTLVEREMGYRQTHVVDVFYNMEHGQGRHRSIREAKVMACQRILAIFERQHTGDVPEYFYENAPPVANFCSDPFSPKGVSALNMLCQKQGWYSPKYTFYTVGSDDHPYYFCQLDVDTNVNVMTFKSRVGHTKKKDSKNAMAINAMSHLVPGWTVVSKLDMDIVAGRVMRDW